VILEEVADLSEDGLTEDYRFHPEPHGLFPWGVSNGGDRLFWRMTGPDPDRWPTVIGTREDFWWEHDGSMLALLVGFITGSIEPLGMRPELGPNPTVDAVGPPVTGAG
jgi:hypothetical protein